MKILHIEDNPDNRRLVRRILAGAGYDVLEAEDGIEGIEVAVLERPDLILLDISMPRLDGYEVAAAMRAFPPLQPALIVALTAHTGNHDRERMLAAGCNGYIAKPIDVDCFPGQVEEFLRGKRERLEADRQPEYLRELNHRLVRHLLQKIQELEERGGIAQDLHDGIIQSIYATGLGLQECLRLLEEDPRHARRKLTEAIDRLDVVIGDVRNCLVGLQPGGLQERGLGWALGELARGLERNALLVAELEVEPGVDAVLGPEEARHLFHVCREALTNVVKHARGSRVQLTLGRSNDVVRLSVNDPRTDRFGQPGSEGSHGLLGSIAIRSNEVLRWNPFADRDLDGGRPERSRIVEDDPDGKQDHFAGAAIGTLRSEKNARGAGPQGKEEWLRLCPAFGKDQNHTITTKSAR